MSDKLDFAGRQRASELLDWIIDELEEAAHRLVVFKAENAALKDEIRRHEEVFQFSANKIAALKRENEAFREWLGEDGLIEMVVVHEVDALLTAEEQE